MVSQKALFILFSLIITVLTYVLPAFAQQRYLVTPDNDAIPLKQGESASAFIQKNNLSLGETKVSACDKGPFGYTPYDTLPKVSFAAHHKEIMAM